MARIVLAEGTLLAASMNGDGWEPAELLREILRWKKGKFAFKAEVVPARPELNRVSVGGLLLEAMRLEDESRR